MKVHIDRWRCEGHGICAGAAPEVYELDAEAVAVLKTALEVPARLEVQAEAGARFCPVTAIRVTR